MTQQLSVSEEFNKKASLLLVRAIESECDTSLSVSITRAHRLHKDILREFRNIERALFSTDMSRKPVGLILHTSLVKRDTGWTLSISTRKAPGSNVVTITDQTKTLLRKWLKSGFKPTTMASWRSTYHGL
ncbi:hypothetical protein OBP_298 [Pseudomonas phage OBP]|uniref:hypothetical protein n=1 Tax=Pseudomonas phage OBP TaxID=1124849 RepID=UPI000240D645|nr:hypothetical protein OBP_298 [Pseudomonas phage OBP]AEV89735.1 hypothetical protein OBP_298 [Pseudomonas phage OBP]